ncbi:unnamed protein product [Notodromas monacha]|uniref:chitin synthase n=1 Tax=Notodromas monacha TaxID=399045 RepID=A0A7R9BIU2_9CRUS|nr:unnamed protein product [Notodromas monacha]CAG0914900.1 unnamed protein product [Notodromas monacha]
MAEEIPLKTRIVGFSENTEFIDKANVEALDQDDDDDEVQQEADEGSNIYLWDAAQKVPPKSAEESEMPKWVENGIKMMKIGAYIITFLVVLASASIGMGTFVFMTAQLKIDRTVSYCNKNYGRDKNLEVKATEMARISWTWMIFFAFATTQLFVFGRSLRMYLFKKVSMPKLLPTFAAAFVFETLHVLGLAMLAFVVLPELDSIKAAMLTSSVCFLPGLFSLLSRNLTDAKGTGKIGEDGKPVAGKSDQPLGIIGCMSFTTKMLLDVAAIGGQLTVIFAWPFVLEPNLGNWKIWLIPVSVLLTSCGWWENYSDYNSHIPFMKILGKAKNDLIGARYPTYGIISIWKIALFLAAMVLYIHFINGEDATLLFDSNLFAESFGAYPINITEVSNFEIGSFGTSSIDSIGQALQPMMRTADAEAALQVFLIHVAAGWTCYIFSKFACKVTITEFSFAFPLNMAMPVVICTMIIFCALRSDNACYFRGSVPDYLFFACPSGDFVEDFILREHGWIWLVWLLSQMWITVHTWSPMNKRLMPTEQIFCLPMYESLLLPQSMMLNRRRDDGEPIKIKSKKDKKKDAEEGEDQKAEETSPQAETTFISDFGVSTVSQKPPGTYPRIVACATMWHETKDEMISCLKSIFRIDSDQHARRLTLEYFGVNDDYYDFETHIFIDDAYTLDATRTKSVVNSFVKDLIDVMPVAAGLIHGTDNQNVLSPPIVYPTPYGGRLVWTLPGKTKVICHVKNKDKIRHKKRWSQCMYMYYLLGYQVFQRSDLSLETKENMVNNTYLLALDGDIEFQPRAVLLLVDLMKKNKNLGAACGRIHPIGTDGAGGLLVWYQQFEYAVGHWFQKATEHVIGCVLCSPGCFSMFRGAALLSNNVMKTYTTKSEVARHFVQYDQGEDRWLCTLMLQQGWKVEYSAASDSYTHCPEGFNEFYNQRRRWVPSTMANILDLLADYKQTVKNNDNISMPYILYQMLLMIGTILGPGTIFMMMTGAFNAAFKIEIMDAFLLNGVPLLAFMLTCYFFDSQYQLMFAQLLTAVYAMVMMAVVVGTALQLQQEGVDSPSGIFFISMAASFVVTGLLHPQELYCLPSGIVYYLTVPSMYLLLIIYSVFNLNNMLLMIGTILGPGTIFMMMTGAFNAAFKIEIMDAFLLNGVPLLAFMLTCYFFDSQYQLMFAQLLTAVYAMVMMAVVVGTALQLQQEGVDSPSGIFFISMAASFVVTGLLHPQELYCLPSGIVYYLTVPSMYLLLIIYSVFNLNNVSWGTREVAKVLSKEEELKLQKEAAEEAAKKAQSKGVLKFIEQFTGADLSGMFSTASGSTYDGFISCMCCAGAKPRDQEATLVGISKSLVDMTKRLEGIEKNIEPSGGSVKTPRRGSSFRRKSSFKMSVISENSEADEETQDENQPLLKSEEEDDELYSDSEEEDDVPEPPRNDLLNPHWMDDKDVKVFQKSFLPGEEITFWQQLIKKYLEPLDDDKKAKEKIQEDLLDLRDKVVATFFMFNAIFVLVVMLLQMNKGALHIDWPLNVKTNISYFYKENEVLIDQEYLELEPVGLVFVFFFFLVLVTQFIAMLFHRLTTLMHLISTCDLGLLFKCGKESQEKETQEGEEDFKKHGLKIVKLLQRTQEEDNEAEKDLKLNRRNTVHNLSKAQQSKKRQGPIDLDKQFRNRFMSMALPGGDDAPEDFSKRRRQTIKQLQTIMGTASEAKAEKLASEFGKRRNTVMFAKDGILRKGSQMTPSNITRPPRPASDNFTTSALGRNSGAQLPGRGSISRPETNMESHQAGPGASSRTTGRPSSWGSNVSFRPSDTIEEAGDGGMY